MTCTPKKPLRCWQYSDSADSVPLWAIPHINAQENGKLEFDCGNSSGTIDRGDWLVEHSSGNISVWADKPFREEFDPRPEAVPE